MDLKQFRMLIDKVSIVGVRVLVEREAWRAGRSGVERAGRVAVSLWGVGAGGSASSPLTVASPRPLVG